MQKRPLENLWTSGLVKRFHTIPMHSHQTTAAHQWGVAAIILALHPSPRLELVRAALFHDVAERETGDMPYTFKGRDPQFKVQMDRMEQDVLEEYYGISFNLTLDEQNWLKCADMLELVIYCAHEIAMGNNHALLPYKNGIEALMGGKKPKEIEDELKKYVEDLWENIQGLKETP